MALSLCGRLVAVGTLADLRARARPDNGAASLETVFFDVLGAARDA